MSSLGRSKGLVGSGVIALLAVGGPGSCAGTPPPDETPRPLIEYYSFGAWACAACRGETLKNAHKTCIANIRQEAEARGMDFRSVCVVMDPDDPEVRVPFGGEKAAASPEFAQATEDEAARAGARYMGFCVEAAGEGLAHAVHGGEKVPFGGSPEYTAALRSEMERLGARSLCVTYYPSDIDFGEPGPLDESLELAAGGEELQVGEAYRSLGCQGYDDVIFSGKGYATEEYRKYVMQSPAIVSPMQERPEGLPYAVQVRDREIVLGRFLGNVIPASEYIFTLEGDERKEFFDCFLNPGRCPDDSWWRRERK